MAALVQLGWFLILHLSLSFNLVNGDPTANLSYGTFQGYYSGNLSVFLGVPFASPPYVPFLSRPKPLLTL